MTLAPQPAGSSPGLHPCREGSCGLPFPNILCSVQLQRWVLWKLRGSKELELRLCRGSSPSSGYRIEKVWKIGMGNKPEGSPLLTPFRKPTLPGLFDRC